MFSVSVPSLHLDGSYFQVALFIACRRLSKELKMDHCEGNIGVEKARLILHGQASWVVVLVYTFSPWMRIARMRSAGLLVSSVIGCKSSVVESPSTDLGDSDWVEQTMLLFSVLVTIWER